MRHTSLLVLLFVLLVAILVAGCGGGGGHGNNGTAPVTSNDNSGGNTGGGLPGGTPTPAPAPTPAPSPSGGGGSGGGGGGSSGGGGGSGSGGTVAPTVSSGIAGSANFRWDSVSTVTSFVNVEYTFFLNTSSIRTNLAQITSGTVAMILRDPNNTAVTIATVQTASSSTVPFHNFRTTRPNGDLLIEFVVLENNVLRERVLDGLTSDPYRVVGANGIDIYLGVTLINGGVYRLGAKSVSGLSGADWPGADGDKFFRWEHITGTNRYNLYFLVGSANLGSPNLALINTWSGFALPATLTAVGDGWYKAADQTIPDGVQDFAVIGVALSGTFTETGRLNLAGSEWREVAGGKDVFRARFVSSLGMVHHPSLTLTTSSGARLEPPFLRLGLNSSNQLQVLADFAANGISYTADVTSQTTSGWTSTPSTVAAITQTGRLTALATGATTVQAQTPASVGGRLTNSVSVTVVNRTPIAVAVSGPNGISPVTTSAGSTVPFTATVTFDDNSTANSSTTVTWQSSSLGVGTLNASGLLTALASGTTQVSALFGGLTSNSVTVSVTGPPPPPPPPPVTITLTALGSTAAITSGGTRDFAVSYSDGVWRTPVAVVSSTSLGSVAVVGSNLRLTANNVLLSDVVSVTAQATINSVLVNSNSLKAAIYGDRGVVDGRIHIRRSTADTRLSTGSGSVVIIADAFGNFSTQKPTRVGTAVGQSGNVDYYELDPSDTAVLTEGRVVRWNIQRGTVFVPDSVFPSPVAVDMKPNGLSSFFFEHTARLSQ